MSAGKPEPPICTDYPGPLRGQQALNVELMSTAGSAVMQSSFVFLVAVSVPKISVEGRAIVGRPVKILCQSDSGSLPINYTLLKDNDPEDTVVVRLPSERAVFTVTAGSAAAMSRFMCEARNGHKDPPLSTRLNVTVVGKCGRFWKSSPANDGTSAAHLHHTPSCVLTILTTHFLLFPSCRAVV